VWDKGRTQCLESRLARLTVSCGWALTWVENPEWLEFCNKFIPGAPTPMRKVLTQRIIPSEVKRYRDIAKLACKGKMGMLQCDGFTVRNRHHLIVFMINCGGNVYTICTFDTSDEPKTAENLRKMIVKVLAIVEDKWLAVTVAVTTDCGGEARAAWSLLIKQRPSLVEPDCYAHQVWVKTAYCTSIL
ncbi:hypothetical protein C8Q74DRAFT_1206957, partial [Fomes fomentarius]